MSEHFVVGIKDALTIAIEQKIDEWFREVAIPADPSTPQFLTARELAEKIVVLIAAFVKTAQSGPTGNFPEGKADASDEGELKMLISHDEKLIRFDFGKATAWIAMPKPQALTFAFTILEHCGVKIEQHDLTKGKPS